MWSNTRMYANMHTHMQTFELGDFLKSLYEFILKHLQTKAFCSSYIVNLTLFFMHAGKQCFLYYITTICFTVQATQ